MDSQETLVSNNAILDAINKMNANIDGLRQEMNQRFNNVEARLRFVEDQVKELKELVASLDARVAGLDARVAHIESEFFSFNVRLKRVEAGVLEAQSIGKNLEADVMIIKAEVLAWSQDIMGLQRKVA